MAKSYGLFSTVDWVGAAERDNRRRLRRPARGSVFAGLTEAGRSWAALMAAGAVIGIIAGILNIVTEWLGDIKRGRCTLGLYLNREFCCAGQSDCVEWRPWTTFGPLDYISYTLFGTLFATVGAVIVSRLAPSAAGSGIAEIKCVVAGFNVRTDIQSNLAGLLSLATLVVKASTLPLTIAAGLSVGKEGPSVHYAAVVAALAQRWLVAAQEKSQGMKPSDRSQRQFLCAGAAAGVSVAFGSPVGGVLFALEEMASGAYELDTLWRSYVCALTGATVLSLVNPFRTGQLVVFSVKYDRDWHYFEIVPYVVLGVFGGLYGIIVSHGHFRVQQFRKRYLAQYPVEEAAALAAFTALICYFNRFLRLDMTASMQILFSECGGAVAADSAEGRFLCQIHNNNASWTVTVAILGSLLTAVIIRGTLVMASYGVRLPAGIFVPSMAVGALFGRLVGTLVAAAHNAWPEAGIFSVCEGSGSCITPGTYAFLGAAAALSGIMNLTMAVVVIMFELTGALRYILPTMIVVGVTRLVVARYGHGGIADQAIERGGYPLVEATEDSMFDAEAREAMVPVAGLACVHHGLQYTVGELKALLQHPSRHRGLPIVDSDSFLYGWIEESELGSGFSTAPDSTPCLLDQGDAQGQVPTDTSGSEPDKIIVAVNASPISVYPTTPMHEVLDLFHKLGPRVVMVQARGRLHGIITRKDVAVFRDGHEPDGSAAAERRAAVDERIWRVVSRAGQAIHGLFGRS